MQIIEITSEAKHKLQEIKQGQQRPEECFLRVGARGGGCGASVSYFLGFDQKEADDQIIPVSGMDLVINKGQLLQLQGLKIDWIESPSEQGFKFTESSLPPVAV